MYFFLGFESLGFWLNEKPVFGVSGNFSLEFRSHRNVNFSCISFLSLRIYVFVYLLICLGLVEIQTRKRVLGLCFLDSI